MITDTSKTSATNQAASLYGIFLLSLATSAIGNLLIRIGARGGWLPPSARIAVGIACSIPFLVAAVLFWRLLRRDLDEMLQRIVLEGLAFAFTVYIPLAALYVNVRTAGHWAPRLDSTDLLLVPALLVAIGVAVARKRYE